MSRGLDEFADPIWSRYKQVTTDNSDGTHTTPTRKGCVDDRSPLWQHSTRPATGNLRSDSDSPFKTNSSVLYKFIHSNSFLSTSPLVKSGYPPRTLAIVPELPFDSLGLQRGDQIFVSEEPNPETRIPSVQQPVGPVSARPTQPPPLPAPTTRPQFIPRGPSGPDHVEVDGGFLIHRVSMYLSYFFVITCSHSGQIVPDDNSCLFSSVALVFEQTISKASDMRKSTRPNAFHSNIYPL